MLEAVLRAAQSGAWWGAHVAAWALLVATFVACAVGIWRGSMRAANAASVLTPAAIAAVLTAWALEGGKVAPVPACLMGAAFAWWIALRSAKRLRGDG